MKKYQFIVPLLTIASFFAACDKSMTTSEPSFKINGYKVTNGVDSLGNAVKNVTFSCEGDAKFVSFYSGELFREYAFKDGRTLNYSSLQMSFTTTVQFGTHPNQLSVMASTDFSGNYTVADVNAATWTNITDRFALATTVGSTTPFPSGTKDISDLKVEGKPLYIGFKYNFNPAFGTQNNWRIRSLSITGQSNIGLQTLANQANAGWAIINGGPADNPTRSQIETGPVINLRSNGDNVSITEAWAVTKGFNTSKANLGPDRPISIKIYVDKPITEYTYQYTSSGEYTVVFVAQNSTIAEQSSVVRTLKIKID